ncbi:MAG TPA: hypothetical protein VMU85_14635 [Stellaceae bacterium]|nr:hypothetical protein [Stellaceae bacterium]
MIARVKWLLALLLVLPAWPAAGAVLGDARVAYNATCALTVDGQTYQGRLYAKPGFQRHEQMLGGVQEVAILDIGAGRGYFVLPLLKSYVDFPIDRAMRELSAPDIAGPPVGREAVNGVATSKYRVAHRADDGTRIDGFVWLTESGVPMRGNGTVAAPDGKKTPFAWELSQLQIGPQPPALFQPPEGFYRLPASALPSFLGGQGG